MKAELVEVIKTETTEGDGTEGNPVRTVIRYWDKSGELITEKTKILFTN